MRQEVKKKETQKNIIWINKNELSKIKLSSKGNRRKVDKCIVNPWGKNILGWGAEREKGETSNWYNNQ